jgi:hypothetical protein
MNANQRKTKTPCLVYSIHGRLFLLQAHAPCVLDRETHLFVCSSFLLLGDLLARQSLLGDTLLPSLSCSLGLRTLGVHLVLEDSLTSLLGLGLVDLWQIC